MKYDYGFTEIHKAGANNLTIQWECDFDPAIKSERNPVLTHTPDMGNPDVHYHIELTREEASQLANWILTFLADVDG